MNEKEIKIDRLSKNFKELDREGKETLLRIGEKVFRVCNFVNREISSLTTEKDEINLETGNKS
ncbi:MAG: hypothetical protein LBH51_04035 [Treponema sp.]|nr:hypothetical protein [Treponema sp.]